MLWELVGGGVRGGAEGWKMSAKKKIQFASKIGMFLKEKGGTCCGRVVCSTLLIGHSVVKGGNDLMKVIMNTMYL